VLLNNCGHWPPFEKPAEWTAQVLAFLGATDSDGDALERVPITLSPLLARKRVQGGRSPVVPGSHRNDVLMSSLAK